jgi:hypothetical protein
LTVNYCGSCPKNPLDVTVTFEKNYPVSDSVYSDSFTVFTDDRPGSGPSTDITDIVVEGTPINKDDSGHYIPTEIVVKYDTGDYIVMVTPLPQHHIAVNQLRERSILGIEMQDGNLIKGEKKAKEKVKKIAKNKAKKSGSRPVKAKKGGKKTKSKK